MAKTQTPFAALMIFPCVVLLINHVKSESLSFSFSNFGPGQDYEIGFLGDARPLGGVIQLTRRENEAYGTPTIRQHSVGRAVYIPPVRLWNKNTGKLADFETEFSFVVDPAGSEIHADGFSFFILPFDVDPRIPTNSSGGYLGLFSPETALDTYKNQIVAVEFDSFGNEWDPVPNAPHIGLDVNSLESVHTIEWPINSVPQGSIGQARISYDSKTKQLSVTVGYTNTHPAIIVELTQIIDLRSVLPEWVRIGFSGSTGDKVETHDILFWSFSSSV